LFTALAAFALVGGRFKPLSILSVGRLNAATSRMVIGKQNGMMVVHRILALKAI